MRSFADIPRVPMTRLLGQVVATGAQRYEMRDMQARLHRELGPVAVIGRGRFANVFLFGPDANRAVLPYRDPKYPVPFAHQRAPSRSGTETIWSSAATTAD